MRIVRKVVLLVVALGVVAAIATVLSSRPKLDDAHEAVETRWRALSVPLDARYAQLGAASNGLLDDAGPASVIAQDVDRALTRWRDVREDGDVGAAVTTANALEGFGRRLDRAVRASPRLAADTAIVAALDGFAQLAPPEPLPAFLAAVRDYEEARTGPLRAVVADVLGYDRVPALVLGSTPEAA